MNNHLVVHSAKKSKDYIISLWCPKMNQIPPHSSFEALKLFVKKKEMKKLWLPEVGGVKIENVVTLGSLFLNIENNDRTLLQCF